MTRRNPRLHPAILLALALLPSPSRADILNWQTNTTIPGTESITPGPSLTLSAWNTASHNLQFADFSNTDIHNSALNGSWLDSARFDNSILSNVNFTNGKLTGATFTGASLDGARFNAISGGL